MTDTSLLVAIAGRLVSVSRRRVYPLAVVLAGEPVSFADLIRLFGGDRSLAAELVDVGGTHGWLEATWVPASPLGRQRQVNQPCGAVPSRHCRG
ncbi:MAG: hypothetical protein IPI82_05280 [Candidatus Microthrix sp.]|nr:hypothetical protein [Candidatus Microthrix sp.]MBK7321864.1 hypothetical protein [Candidatus Microthrix sp.]